MARNEILDAQKFDLSEEIRSLQIERLTEERVYLLQILYHVATLFLFDSNDIITLVEMLEPMNLSEQGTPYLLVALLAAISPIHHIEAKTKERQDEAFLKTFHEHVTERSWAVPATQSVVLLQWGAFLISAADAYPDIEAKLSMSEGRIEKLIEQAISEKAFEFMNEYLLYFQQNEAKVAMKKYTANESTDEEWYMMVDGLAIDPCDYKKIKPNIRTDFQVFIVQELELLTVGLISNATNVLRNLKYREEDANMLAATPSNLFMKAEQNSSGRCNDLEMFFMLLSNIYRGRYNAGYRFWSRDDSGLFHFIKWATDIKVTATTRAFYEFLGSISTGDLCALCTYKYLEQGTIAEDIESSSALSWGKLFAALQFYIPRLQRVGEGSTAVLSQEEEGLLEKLLYILKQVVLFSNEARLALWNERSLRVGDTIIEMVNRPTSSSLRVALYDVLTAFCSASEGGISGVGSAISLRVWHILEGSDYFISERNTDISNMDGNQKRVLQYVYHGVPSIVKRLEEERRQQHYPETMAILDLLASLIHTQSKRDELISGFEPVMSISFPWDLGKDTRSPGLEPYISFVVDRVFLSLNSQSYRDLDHKWILAAKCLKIMENSVSSFDIRPVRDVDALSVKPKVERYTESLQGVYNGGEEMPQRAVTNQMMLLYITHPGFSVISRILSGTDLAKELFELIVKAADSATIKEKNPHLIQCVVHCLRIMYRILQVQDVFGNLVIPYIMKFASRLPSGSLSISGYTFPALPSLAPLGQIMLYHSGIIQCLPRLFEYEEEEEMNYLSTKILHILSLEPRDSNDPRIAHVGLRNTVGGLGTKLAEILGEGEEHLSTVFRFSERIIIDKSEMITYDDYEYDINNIPFWRSTIHLENKRNLENAFQGRSVPSVRLAIMDMLLDNTASGKPVPSIADLLLGKSVLVPSDGSTPQHRESNATKMMCLHAVLDTLSDNIDRDDEYATFPPISSNPLFVEKCYQVIYQLCARQKLSLPILRYLRIRDNFFYTQLNALPPRLETQVQIDKSLFAGTMVYADGTRITTDFFVLRAQLYQRAWLLKGTAIELHVAQKADAIRLLKLLYGYEKEDLGASGTTESGNDTSNSNLFHTNAAEFEQPLAKMLDLLTSFDFKWQDHLEETLDVSELKFFKAFNAKAFEMRNDRGCVVYDIQTIYTILRREQRSREERNSALSQEDQMAMEREMGQIIQKLVGKNHENEINYAKMHCLEAWKQVVQVTFSSCFGLFPLAAREIVMYDLIANLLPRMQSSVDVDVDALKGFSEIVLILLTRLKEDGCRRKFLRTDTTAETSRLPKEKLHCIFIGIFDCIQAHGTNDAIRGNLYTALVGFMQYIEQSGNNDILTAVAQKLHQRIMVDSKLLNVICSDATEGLDIWKPTAYLALDGLLVLASKAKDYAIRAILLNNNFLQYSIDTLQRDDHILLNILRQRDVTLTPLYIYEAQLVFFMRLATTVAGAEMLMGSGILNVLSRCRFMHVHRDMDALHNDNDLVQRYDRLMIRALELVVALSNTVGRTNRNAMMKLEAWVKKQDIVAHILEYDQQKLTMPCLYRLKLITSVFYQMSCHREYFIDMEKEGLDQLHAGIIQLATKFFAAEISANEVSMVNEKQILTNGSVSATTSMKVDDCILCIQKNILAYAKNATFVVDKQGRLLKPLFAHRFASITDRSLMRSTSSKTPSLTTLVTCLQNAIKNLQNAVAEHKLLQTQQNNIASLKYEEIREVANTAIPPGLGIEYDHLNPTQQQQVLAREIETRRKLQWKRLQNQLFVVENVLLVLWRHLEYYMRPVSSSRSFMQSPCDPAVDEAIMSSQATLFQPSVVVSQNLRNTCTTLLEPILEKLASVDLSGLSDTSGAYIVDVCERIKRLYH
ncbi:hypothetical protein EC973_004498 [Apophysomyces ossiformis]|uniref:Uncharacterized protein n=1 Tax=Apophysomyces ossiformis TaxID=679940 RepID=A0A8H7EMG2_9FUNG|nr:hypothetical protein EC973_004498 [Apophysomyces ossiformis]